MWHLCITWGSSALQKFWEKVFQDKNGTSSLSAFKVLQKQPSTKPSFQRKSHARGSPMYINNIKTMHSTCCWHLILSDSEEYGEISWRFLSICIGTGGRTFMCRSFRPRKNDFTSEIQQDLSRNVCNTPLDSLIHQFYLFILLSGNQWRLLFGLLCSGRVLFIIFHN